MLSPLMRLANKRRCRIDPNDWCECLGLFNLDFPKGKGQTSKGLGHSNNLSDLRHLAKALESWTRLSYDSYMGNPAGLGKSQAGSCSIIVWFPLHFFSVQHVRQAHAFGALKIQNVGLHASLALWARGLLAL